MSPMTATLPPVILTPMSASDKKLWTWNPMSMPTCSRGHQGAQADMSRNALSKGEKGRLGKTWVMTLAKKAQEGKGKLQLHLHCAC